MRILVGGERTLTPRFAALASHYLLEPCFCRPGEGHDKGGVEARGKALRRQALVPIPSGADARRDQCRAARASRCAADARRRRSRARFAEEQRAWRPAPEPFVAEATTLATVSPRAARAARGRVLLGAVSLGRASISSCASVRARSRSSAATARAFAHPRKRFGERSIDYRHYLPELARKPQAVRQVLPELLRDLGDAVSGGLGAPRTRRTARARPRGSWPRSSASSRRAAPAMSCRRWSRARDRDAADAGADRDRRARRADRLPAALRDLDIASGCAADYDGWLTGAPA